MTAVLAACILLTSFTAPAASRGAPVTDEDPVLPETLLPETLLPETDAPLQSQSPPVPGSSEVEHRVPLSETGSVGSTPTPGVSGGILPDTATDVQGTASWFCGGGSACTRGVPPGSYAAAAGPALRVGDWRGRIVKVCGNGNCVRVALRDWCACPRRVIDLYRSAFSKLASPSRGLLKVTVSWGGNTITVPPTDTR